MNEIWKLKEGRKWNVNEIAARKGHTVGMHGQQVYGGTTVQATSQIIWSIPQRLVATVSNQDLGTERQHAFSRL